MTDETNQCRNLTDKDVEALATALREMVIKEFYEDLGKGIWSIAWKTIVVALIAIAAYGAGAGKGLH